MHGHGESSAGSCVVSSGGVGEGQKVTGAESTGVFEEQSVFAGKVVGAEQELLYKNVGYGGLRGVSQVFIPEVCEGRTQGEQKEVLPKFPKCTVNNKAVVKLQRPPVGKELRGGYPRLAQVYDAVSKSKRPNYRGCRIQLDSQLNLPEWVKDERVISDKSLVDMLSFGFPVGFEGSTVPSAGCDNHGSAIRFPADISRFFEKELSFGAIVGPFIKPPFYPWNRVNPLMSRPKRDSEQSRVILDLSYPEGQSVNAGIPSGWLDGEEFKMKLPGPWDLADEICRLGRGALLYKVDLSRAYRQLRSCPLDWPLLTMGWEGQYFVDVAVPFGLRHGASACQRTTEAVADVVADEAGARIWAYIDDSVGAALPVSAVSHYDCLLSSMSRLGLQAAPEKCIAPTTRLCWIGVIFDSILMQMQIEPDRIEEALQWCEEVLVVAQVNRRKFQQFMGKLQYATRCTSGTRVFMNRLLDFMSTLHLTQQAPLPLSAGQDIAWVRTFLKQFNGCTMIRSRVASVVVCIDACPRGLGGVWWGEQFYRVPLPESIKGLGLPISSIECYNLLVALRLWVSSWRALTVLIFSDNWATVCAMQLGRAQDSLISSVMREAWLLAALGDVELVIRHLPGADMGVADALSRESFSEEAGVLFERFRAEAREVEVGVSRQVLSPPAQV